MKGKFNIFLDSIWMNLKSRMEKLKFKNVIQCNTILDVEGMHGILCETFTPYTWCENHFLEKKRDWDAYHLIDKFKSDKKIGSVEYFKEKALTAVNEHILKKQYIYSEYHHYSRISTTIISTTIVKIYRQ